MTGMERAQLRHLIERHGAEEVIRVFAEVQQEVRRTATAGESAGDLALHCSFCGSRRDGNRLVRGKEASICTDCLDLANNVVASEAPVP